MATTKAYRVAKALTASGISVIWIPCGKKWPFFKWKEYETRIADDTTLKKWFDRELSIATIGGAVSGNLEIMDFDEPEYYPAFEEVCGTGRLGALVQSCHLAQTPSGGHHLYYRCSEPVCGNTKLARTAVNRETKEGGVVKIETRGEGGYVLTYPSKGYRLLRGRPVDLPVLSATEVALLHSIAMLFDDYVEEVKPAKVQKNTTPQVGLTPWEDYDQRGDYTEILKKHGWTLVRCNASDHCMWRRPGKSSGVSATTGYSGKRMFYCFSSNGGVFEPKAYFPFDVYKTLEHNGDGQAATRALRKLGYGIQGGR